MKRFFKYPKIIIGVITALTLFFAFQLPRAELDNNTFRFMPEQHPARIAQARMDDQYGSTISILVGFKQKYGTILDRDFLLKLKEFSAKVEKLPRVDSVTSIMNIDYISGDGDGIKVAPLVNDEFSGTREEIDLMQQQLLEWDLYRRAIVSDDFRSTQVLVNLGGDSDESGSTETVKLYDQIKELVAETDFGSSEVFMTGMPAFTSVMNSAMRADLVILIPLVVLVVLFILFASFRRVGGVVLPMLTVVVSTIWSVGLMALLGVKLSMLATVLPVILVAVGSAYGIHIISHYYDEMSGKKYLSKEDHQTIIFHVLKRIGRPVLLAALTTFAGFVSLAFTSVVPIQEFGIFASFGVMVAFLVALLLIPSLLLVQGPRQTKLGAAESQGINEQGLDAEETDAHLEADPLARTFANGFGAVAAKPRLVLLATLGLIVLAGFGASLLQIDNVIIEYFKADTEIARSDVFIRKEFAGSKTISVVIRGDEPGSLTNPEILEAMDKLSVWLEKEMPGEVGKISGFHQLIKRINQVFNTSESPEGLKALAQTSATMDTDTGTSEFGEFGDFGDFGSFEESTETANENTDDTALPLADLDALSRIKAVELISDAYAQAGGRAASAGDLVEALQRQVNYRGASYYEIPTDLVRYGKTEPEQLKNLVGNYLVLLSGDIKTWANDPLAPSEARLNVQLRTTGNSDTMRVVRAIESYVASEFPQGYAVEVGGIAMVEQALNELVVSSQLTSIIASLLLVFLILAVYYRSFSAGLIGIFTLGITILVNFGIMGIAGIRLNIGTALVGSIAIGTGIDYIIHYLAAFHHENLAIADKARVLRRTFLTSGKAIIFNAVSVAAGFAVLAFSQFNMLVYLGVLIASAMMVASLVSLTVLPVLIVTFKPKFVERALPDYFKKA